MKYQIDESLCTGCGSCADVCREGAIIEPPVETMPANVSLSAAVTRAAKRVQRRYLWCYCHIRFRWAEYVDVAAE